MTRTIAAMVSGGVASWLSARTAFRADPDARHLAMFTDTLAEDSDLYRVLIESVCNLFGAEVPARLLAWLADLPEYHQNMDRRRAMLAEARGEMARLVPNFVWLCDGRDPWAVFQDERFIGNSRHDPCSKCLKRNLADRWLDRTCDKAETVVVVGIDWSEDHRFFGRWTPSGYKPGLQARRVADGWTYDAPLCRGVRLTKSDMLAELERDGIARSNLYELGFRHDNCSGFCCKAGLGQFAHFLRVLPERYEFAEHKEDETRRDIGRDDVTVLRIRRGDQSIPITLTEFRHLVKESPPGTFQGWGGCGCMIDGSDDANAIRTEASL